MQQTFPNLQAWNRNLFHSTDKYYQGHISLNHLPCSWKVHVSTSTSAQMCLGCVVTCLPKLPEESTVLGITSAVCHLVRDRTCSHRLATSKSLLYILFPHVKMNTSLDSHLASLRPAVRKMDPWIDDGVQLFMKIKCGSSDEAMEKEQSALQNSLLIQTVN